MCPKSLLHLPFSQTAGGAGDPERRARRGGWRGGAADSHPQGSAVAGRNKNQYCIQTFLKSFSPFHVSNKKRSLSVTSTLNPLSSCLNILVLSPCWAQSQLEECLKKQANLQQALDEAKEENENEKKNSDKAKEEWERHREAMKEELSELTDNMRLNCEMLKKMEGKRNVQGGPASRCLVADSFLLPKSSGFC